LRSRAGRASLTPDVAGNNLKHILISAPMP
jgi:hypothetical protein